MSLHRITLLTSAKQTASGMENVFDMAAESGGGSQFSSGLFELVVSEAGGLLPTLDAFVQMEMPDGDYDDLVVFAQVSGVAKRFATVTPTPGHAEGPVSDKALTLSAAKGLVLGAKYRVKWTIGGTTPTFTFAVLADLYD